MEKTIKVCDLCETEKRPVAPLKIYIGEVFDGHKMDSEHVKTDLCDKCTYKIESIAKQAAKARLVGYEPMLNSLLYLLGRGYFRPVSQAMWREHASVD